MDLAYIANQDSRDIISKISHTKWDAKLGTPIGVVVIPQGILPDGDARIMGLKGVDNKGQRINYELRIRFGGGRHDCDGLTSYDEVPMVDTNTNEITGVGGIFAVLPSDKFKGKSNRLDKGTKWHRYGLKNYAPSPYKDGTLNPVYCATEYTGGTINNALSDFNGIENTRIMCQSSVSYPSAKGAHLYKAYDGDILEWYLPAMGELGFIMPRFKAINEAMTSVGGVKLNDSTKYWSSTYYKDYIASICTTDGSVSIGSGYDFRAVRPFTRLTFK